MGSQPTFMRCAQLLRLLCLTLRCPTGTVSFYSIWRLIVRSYNTLLLKVETGLCCDTGLPLFFVIRIRSKTHGISGTYNEYVQVIRVINSQFLGAFAKFRKATVVFVMSVRLFARMEQLGFYLRIIHKV